MKIDDTDNPMNAPQETDAPDSNEPVSEITEVIEDDAVPSEESTPTAADSVDRDGEQDDTVAEGEAPVIDDVSEIPVTETSHEEPESAGETGEDAAEEEETFGGEMLVVNPDSEDELIDELNTSEADDTTEAKSGEASDPAAAKFSTPDVDHTNLVTVLEYTVTKSKPEDDEENPRTFSNVLEARSVLEGYLFSCNEPLSLQRLSRLMNNLHPRTLQGLLTELQLEYESRPGALQIVEIAGGYQMATRPNIAPWMFRLHKHRKRSNLSPATLETLAIVAYKQPVTKGDIEAIRGVESSAPLRTLQDLNLIESRARREVIGRPQLFNTTDQFLKTFGLKSLGDMPSISELRTQFADDMKLNRAAVSPTEPLRRAKPEEDRPVTEAENPLAGFMAEEEKQVSEDGAAETAEGATAPPQESVKPGKSGKPSAPADDDRDDPVDEDTDELLDLDDIDDEIEDEEVDLELENELYAEDEEDYDDDDRGEDELVVDDDIEDEDDLDEDEDEEFDEEDEE